MAQKPVKTTCSNCGHTYDPKRYRRCEVCSAATLNLALGRKVGGNLDTVVKAYDKQHGTRLRRDAMREIRRGRQ
jgi:uncharacterized OB-fold protein